MELIYDAHDHVYAFALGAQIVPLSDEPESYPTEEAALAAARSHGLSVDSWGLVQRVA